jgi:hypothetical protein
MKIGLMGAEMIPADGQTDMTKLTVAFRNFESAPENGMWFKVNVKDREC